LPTSWKEDDIRKFFEEYGRILDVKLIHKNYGFTGSSLVKFASLGNSEEAIEKLKNTVIPGATRPVNIKWLDTEEQRLGLGQDNDHKLFVGSLPRQASRETLYEVFSLLG
jgi:RNA recognition motif-containing protein